jgi:hypothetical protein
MDTGHYADADRKAKAALAALAPLSAPNDSAAGKPSAARKP